jgi:transcriptional regulator
MALYLPSAFSLPPSYWPRLVAAHPLATLISGQHISHLPLLLEREDRLLGHLAYANPHRQSMEGECVAIFQGPQGYISPLWYEECDVPTWNYVVAHAYGKARLLPESRTIEVVEKLSKKMEGAGGWEFRIPDDLKDSLHQAIRAFEIRVERTELKGKLSQNRSAADREGVIRGLRARKDTASEQLVRWMEAVDA